MNKMLLVLTMTMITSHAFAESYRGREAQDNRNSCSVDVTRDSEKNITRLKITMSRESQSIDAGLLRRGEKGTKVSMSGFYLKTIKNERVIKDWQDDFESGSTTLKTQVKQAEDGQLVAAQAGIWIYRKDFPFIPATKRWEKNAECVDLIRQ